MQRDEGSGELKGPMDAAIDPHALDEAADWLVRLTDTGVTEADRAACLRWQAADPENARAWSRAEALLGKLDALPRTVALPVLDRAPVANRRRALGRLVVLLALLPAGWLGLRVVGGGRWAADHRTGVGERLDVTLADGSQVILDTASAISIAFSAGERRIRLLAGQILVQTVPDPLAAGPAHVGPTGLPGRPGSPAASGPSARPFRVQTDAGQFEALGTRFLVRVTGGIAEVSVLEGRVRAMPLRGTAIELAAGQQARLDAMAVAEPRAVSPGVGAWTRGMLLADRLPLGDLVEELGRYRRGYVGCEPALAGLPVSGSFPIGDTAATDRTLAMLAATYPIRLRRLAGGLWIRLEARLEAGRSSAANEVSRPD